MGIELFVSTSGQREASFREPIEPRAMSIPFETLAI
jgi:hypothetical protein